MSDGKNDWLYSSSVPQGDASAPARFAPEDRARYAGLEPPATGLEYLLSREMARPRKWIEQQRAEAGLKREQQLEEMDRLREWAEAKRYVYFIRCGERGPIKIGITDKPMARLAGLQTGHFEELRMLGYVEGTIAAEKHWHEMFDYCRLRGEWFGPDPKLLAEVKKAIGSSAWLP